MKEPASLPGPVVAMTFSNDCLALFAIYEKPRRWWHRAPRYGVKHYPGEAIPQGA